MNNNTRLQQSDQPAVRPTDAPPDPAPDWRALRRAERTERRTARHAARATCAYGWVGGTILVLLGAIFLLQNFGMLTRFDNWWALFILIPAAGSLVTAWNLYQHAGQRWTPAATGPLTGGLILAAVALAFLLGLNIGALWPLLLILGGAALLLGGLYPQTERRESDGA